MTGIVLPGSKRVFIGIDPWALTGLTSTFSTMDLTLDSCAYIGQVETSDGGSHTIDTSGSSSIGFQVGGATFLQGGTTFKVGIADVDLTAGPPARAVHAANLITFGVEWSGVGSGSPGIAANTWNVKVPTSGTKTIAHGALIAIAFQMTVRAPADTISVNMTVNSFGNRRPSITAFAPSTYTVVNAAPNALITFADGATGWIHGSQIHSTLSTRAYSSSLSPNEYGQLFQLPFPTTIYGAYGVATIPADVDVVLYSDPLGTPVAVKTTSLDANTMAVATLGRFEALFATPYQVAANQPVAIVMKPTTTTNITVPYKLLASATHRVADPWGTAGHAVQRSGGTGAFANSGASLHHYYLGLLTGGFDDGMGLVRPTYGLGV